MDPHMLAAVRAAPADTVLALQAQGPLAVATDIAVIAGAVAVLVLALAGVAFLGRLRRVLDEVQAAVRQNLGPVSDRARSISDNVEFVTQAVRADVQRLNASVKALSSRLQQASDHMEERIEEFNALMEVVQSEAEGLFLDTAATVRGVREGARSIARPGSGAPRRAAVGGADADPEEGVGSQPGPTAAEPDPARDAPAAEREG